ncbi:hypothetical protein CKAH01_01855 [Colletotrichum kahawae]|uniref:Uncharacterized protein n=1 Tax=Colletotrichum kahawae TaxID=34407 RepID=A0AAD9Y469_COLKA|nr:hypothetical protein CKAH01_01855 [Colletotrichum kahawae]
MSGQCRLNQPGSLEDGEWMRKSRDEEDESLRGDERKAEVTRLDDQGEDGGGAAVGGSEWLERWAAVPNRGEPVSTEQWTTRPRGENFPRIHLAARD